MNLLTFTIEYISQLESEIATKVTENGDLRTQNRALAEENRRLSDLTRMLLSSPSFSNFLDHLSSAPTGLPQQQQQQQAPVKVEQRQPEPRQLPKDVNPYGAAQNQQQQQIGMAMIPEQTMDFSMLNIDGESFNYQPQVFTVLETPEVPEIDTAALSGKSSNFSESLSSDSKKIEVPAIESPILSMEKPQTPAAPLESVASTTAGDLDGDIYDDDVPTSSAAAELEPANLSTDIFGGVEPEKVFARYELVDSSEEELAANIVVKRVERLSASLESTLANLERLTIGL
jgi:bZIP-type transcription factor MBZ1